MPLDVGKKEPVTIIDRTIPEVLDGRKLSRLDIIELSWALKSLGADIIEITPKIFGKIAKMPKGIDFMLRINSPEDIALLAPCDIRNVVIGSELAHLQHKLRQFTLQRIIVEYYAEGPGDLYRILEKKNQETETNGLIMRFLGLNRCASLSWLNIINKIKSRFKTKADICPQNQTNLAASIAIEGMMHGQEYITTSFMGLGKPRGFAALEEVLMAAKVMINPGLKINFDLLPSVCGQFSKIAGIKIPDNKPILGKSIFRYESGVHADGIDKNPATYEPFDPQLVGQKRKVSIGKHSGRKSVEKMLNGLGISYNKEEIDSIVQGIRQESIRLGRSLEDCDVVRMFLKSDAI